MFKRGFRTVSCLFATGVLLLRRGTQRVLYRVPRKSLRSRESRFGVEATDGERERGHIRRNVTSRKSTSKFSLERRAAVQRHLRNVNILLIEGAYPWHVVPHSRVDLDDLYYRKKGHASLRALFPSIASINRITNVPPIFARYFPLRICAGARELIRKFGNPRACD